MTTILIEQTVRDYEGWKRAFDQNPLRRGRAGVVKHVLLRAPGDPGVVFVQLLFAQREDAEAYLLELRRMLPNVAETIGLAPDGSRVWILDEVETVAY